MAFNTDIDIANRALQHCGAPRIVTFADGDRGGAETGFVYDKLRVAELRRSVWRFATRRAILRPLTATSLLMIPPVYSLATAYVVGRIVQDANGVYWICIRANTGVVPGTMTAGTPPYWSQYFGPVVADLWAAGTYNAGEIVYTAGPIFYILKSNGVTANPVAGAPWVVLTDVTNDVVSLLEPAGVNFSLSGGQGQAVINRYAFRLPNGFLRAAAPDPKVAGTSNLTTSAALRNLDWQFEGDFIVSATNTPILLRFVADVSHVPSFDALFCEGLGARVGFEVAQTLTQSAQKQQQIGTAYTKFMREARIVNSIEIGSTEPDEEDYALTGGRQAPAAASAQPVQQG